MITTNSSSNGSVEISDFNNINANSINLHIGISNTNNSISTLSTNDNIDNDIDKLNSVNDNATRIISDIGNVTNRGISTLGTNENIDDGDIDNEVNVDVININNACSTFSTTESNENVRSDNALSVISDVGDSTNKDISILDTNNHIDMSNINSADSCRSTSMYYLCNTLNAEPNCSTSDRKSINGFIEERGSVLRYVRDKIADAQDLQKEQADKTGRLNTKTYKKHEKVLLSTYGLPPHVVTNLGSNKFLPRYIGPFRVLSKHGDAYKIDIPSRMKLHPVFYVGLKSPYIK